MGSIQLSAARDTVRLYNYDASTDIATVSVLPASELPPNMVCVVVQGLEGRYWVKSTDIQEVKETMCPEFDPELVNIIRDVQHALREVAPASLQRWEDQFRREDRPEEAIEQWVRLSWVYTRIVEELELPIEAKKEIFKVLVSCVAKPRNMVLTGLPLHIITAPLAEKVVATFFAQFPDRTLDFASAA